MKIDHYKNVWLHLFKNTIEIFLINIYFIFNFNDFGQIKNFKKSHIFLYFKPRPVTPSLPYSAVGAVKRSLLLTEKVRTTTPEQGYSDFSWRLMTIIPIKWRQSDVTCPLQKCCVHDMRKYCHSNKLYASTFGGLFSLKTVHLFDMRFKNRKIILFHRLTLIILWKSLFLWFWVQ